MGTEHPSAERRGGKCGVTAKPPVLNNGRKNQAGALLFLHLAAVHATDPPLEGWPLRGRHLVGFLTASAWRRWGSPSLHVCSEPRVSEEQARFYPSGVTKAHFEKAGFEMLVTAPFQMFMSLICRNLCLTRGSANNERYF